MRPGKFCFVVVSLLLYFSISSPISLNAQFYNIGNDPARARWMQINSDNYKLIFPKEIDSLALEYLYQLEKYRPLALNSLRIEPDPIPVLLHPYTTVSNGMVTWAPKRVELITMPSAYSGYSEPWIKQLALHESRHIGQVSHFTTGIYKYLQWFIGEQAPGIGVGLYPGIWLLESDAVITETILGNAGRGRSASFLAYHRAAFLNGDYRDWNKWRFGSYKYRTPNVYAFGYLVTSAIKTYSENPYVIGEILSDYVDKFHHFGIFSNTIRRKAGKSKYEFLNMSMEVMTSIWRNDLEKRGELTKGNTLISRQPRYYSEYCYPVSINDNEVVAIRKGMNYLPYLVKIDSTGKERGLKPFSSLSSKLIFTNGKIFWTEYKPGLRWELETFSLLKSYDLESGVTETISDKNKVFNPSVNDRADAIAVVEYCVDGRSNLLLLDMNSSEIIRSIPAYQKGEIKEVVLTDSLAYCTIITEKGMGLFSIDPYRSSEEWSCLIEEQSASIIDMTNAKNRIIFVSDLDGVDNIYQFDPDTKLLRRLTNSAYGTYSPSFDMLNYRLLYSELRPDGIFPVSTPLDSLSWAISDLSKPYKHPIAELLTLQSKEKRSMSFPDSLDFKMAEWKRSEQPYKKYTHLFNFHSWAPVYYNVDRIRNMSYENLYDLASLGAVLYSQNLLGTMTSMIGYSYHNGFHSGHLKFTYSGLYPIIEYSLDINDRNSIHRRVNSDNVLGVYHTSTPYIRSNLSAYIPFNLSSGGWTRGLIPQVTWQFTNDAFYSYNSDDNQYRQQLRAGIRYYQVLPTPKAAIFPRLGFGLSTYFNHPLNRGENFGNQLYFGSYFYLPGITSTQGTKLSMMYQRQFSEEKVFITSFYASLPRGNSNAVTKEKYVMFSADYAIPVYLGDISLTNMLYLQRLQLIPFLDYAINYSSHEGRENLYSAGADVLFDCYLFQFDAPISIGFRYSRNNGVNPNYFGFLFNISI